MPCQRIKQGDPIPSRPAYANPADCNCCDNGETCLGCDGSDTPITVDGVTKCCDNSSGPCIPNGYSFGVNSRSGGYECCDTPPPDQQCQYGCSPCAWSSIIYTSIEECNQWRNAAIEWYSNHGDRYVCPDHDFYPCNPNSNVHEQSIFACCNGQCCRSSFSNCCNGECCDGYCKYYDDFTGEFYDPPICVV